MIYDLIAPLIIGFIGSLHCLGMCGPLVLAYSLHLKAPADRALPGSSTSLKMGLGHHLFFHSGRLFTYGFLGALGAGLFYVADLKLIFLNLRGGMTLLAGAFMVFFGLALLRVIPLPNFLTIPSMAHGSFWGRLFPPLFRSQRLGSKMILGLATGFLPCGLSWAMIAKAAATQHIPEGFLTMISFGLGTVPALLLIGLSASFFSLKMRFLGERVAALSIIAMGLIVLFKGVKVFG